MRCIIIAIDGLGIGNLPDSKDFKNNNLKNEKVNIKSLVTLQRLGLSYLLNGKQDPNIEIESSFGRMAIDSNVISLKSSIWELTGVITTNFLDKICDIEKEDIEDISKDIGVNLEFGKPKESEKIFISIHEDNTVVISSKKDLDSEIINKIKEKLLENFYIENIVVEKLSFNGANIVESKEKNVYNKILGKPNLFSKLIKFGYSVVTVGRHIDFFKDEDQTEKFYFNSDKDIFEKLTNIMDDKFDGVIFSLFSDFYLFKDKREEVLEKFDEYLKEILNTTKDDDIIFLTSTTGVKKSSHIRSREYIPVCIYGNLIKENVYVGVRHSAIDMAQTILDLFGIDRLDYGKSFKKLIMEG
jgi:phosphopentomutase